MSEEAKKPSKRSPTRWPNVVRYPDGTYYAFIKPLGASEPKEISLKTKKAMQVPDALKLAELKAERSMFAGSKLTFDETIDDYLESGRTGKGRQRAWKPRTYELQVALVKKHLRPFFGKYKIIDIDHIAWDKFTEKGTLSDYQNARNLLRNFLTECMRKQWIKVMPLEFRLPAHTRRKRRILNQDEIRALVEKASGKIELFLHFILFHGVRGDEVREVKYEGIHWHKSAMIVDGKTGPRAIPVFKYTLELLKRHRVEAKSPYLFPMRGHPDKPAARNWHRKAWKNLLKKAGLVDLEGKTLNITPHDLRATAEKYAAKLGGFSDVEREKMFGASVEVQNNIYITEFFVDELRGMEAALIDSNKGVEGLEDLLQSKRSQLGYIWDGQQRKGVSK